MEDDRMEYYEEVLTDKRFIVVSAPHGMMPPLACRKCGRHMFQTGTYMHMRVLTCENACDQYTQGGTLLPPIPQAPTGTLPQDQLIELLWYCFHAKDREINHLKQALGGRK